jgi:hypothetical protein
MQSAMHEVPPLEMPDSLGEAESLFQFFKQYGDQVAAWDAVGVPVVELAHQHARRPGSRTKEMRDRRRRHNLACVDIRELVVLVRHMIDREAGMLEAVPF